MHPVRRQRLFLVIFIVVVASIAAGLMIYSLGSNLNVFYAPSKIVEGAVPTDVRIRAGGMVVKGSIERASDSLFVQFAITDGPAQVTVNYSGILPDLFGEGEAALVAGMLDNSGVFQADEVLAKHDENYTPPEVEEAMQQGHEWKEAQRKEEMMQEQRGQYDR